MRTCTFVKFYITKLYFRKYLNRKKKSIFVTFLYFFCCLFIIKLYICLRAKSLSTLKNT